MMLCGGVESCQVEILKQRFVTRSWSTGDDDPDQDASSQEGDFEDMEVGEEQPAANSAKEGEASGDDDDEEHNAGQVPSLWVALVGRFVCLWNMV